MQVAIHEIDDVLMFAVLHDQDLIDDQILLGLQVQVHLLDGDASVGTSLIGRNTPPEAPWPILFRL